jgi:hypothetical protein
MDNESAFWYLQEIENDTVLSIMNEWDNAKGKSGLTQNWRVIKANNLINEYKYNRKTGLVHEKNIEKFQEICVENYCKLYVNTVLMGHTSIDPYDYLEGHISEDWDNEKVDEWLEDFEWFAIDNSGSWRISDYGLEKIGNFTLKLLEEEDYSKKIYWIDSILSVTHMRSNLSSWFVEGGNITLNTLFEQ